MLAVQLGESANELIAQWKREGGGYRYGFPDFYAAEFPVRPMYYDQSRIYSGVFGRHYPGAKTSRYNYLYDPNMYMQPGFGADPVITIGPATVTPIPTPLSPGARAAIAVGILATATAGAIALFHVGTRTGTRRKARV